jgi:RimJ/RimL family protein N-acetyltransferase
MINHPYILGAIARERVASLLEEAEAAHRASQARSHRLRAGGSDPGRSLLGWICHRLRHCWSRVGGQRMRSEAKRGPVVLRDGSAVLIRPVRGTDAPLLADGFARLSARSRQMRFLTPKHELTPAELGYFTEVDHHDHEALGALNYADGRGVGIARYVRDAGDPQAAAIAVTIVDDWQGRGLGTELLARLADRARCEGIRRFTALVSADNAAAAGVLRNVSARLAGRGPGTVEYEITLAPGPGNTHVDGTGSAAASGPDVDEEGGLR